MVAALALGGCATPVGGATATPSPAVESATPAPSPSSIATPSPEPTPTETSTMVTPYNGEVLIVTAELVGSRLEVTAMVPGVSESHGTCTLHLVDYDLTATVQGTAGNDVTYCGLMSLEAPLPVHGPLQFDVAYDTPSTHARSALSEVEPAG